jgi:hypothetical protein
MKLSEFKAALTNLTELNFKLPDGSLVPKHFHITEIGQVSKKFIDCGGTVREENLISMQLWESIDFWHRLEPSKLISIIDLSIQKLGIEDHEIEIEYQGNTIGKYGVTFSDNQFKLLSTKTQCLAEEKCGIPSFNLVKEKVQACCSPGGGCC